MKKLKNKLITLRQNTGHYFIVLINIVHEKENQFKSIVDKNHGYNVKYEFDQIMEITHDYANIQYKFLKDKKKIENRNKINELNTAKQDFMISLHICEDVKRHIYSFL